MGAVKVIIAGSRSITNYRAVENAIKLSGWQADIEEVVCGGARGVDALGRLWANTHGIPVVTMRANWKKHGKAAGPIRNREMADYAQALIAVWDGVSRGTDNMIREAERRGLHCFVYTVGDSE